MRVLLVGTSADRARLRRELAGVPIEIAGEFGTLEAARASSATADAILLASVEDGRGLEPRSVSRLEEDEIVDEPLTPREIEVLESLAEGLPNKAIAVRLGISDQTVKFHVSSICGKLGAANRTDAVRRAVRRGLITL
jgi:DNA-binding NarL/FixJ family response regulator